MQHRTSAHQNRKKKENIFKDMDIYWRALYSQIVHSHRILKYGKKRASFFLINIESILRVSFAISWINEWPEDKGWEWRWETGDQKKRKKKETAREWSAVLNATNRTNFKVSFDI